MCVRVCVVRQFEVADPCVPHRDQTASGGFLKVSELNLNLGFDSVMCASVGHPSGQCVEPLDLSLSLFNYSSAQQWDSSGVPECACV